MLKVSEYWQPQVYLWGDSGSVTRASLVLSTINNKWLFHRYIKTNQNKGILKSPIAFKYIIHLFVEKKTIIILLCFLNSRSKLHMVIIFLVKQFRI